MRILLLSLGFLLCAGCATNQYSETVPYPRSTPFDADTARREAFLDGFRSGYRSVATGDFYSQEMLPSSFREARRLGFEAGRAQAGYDQEQAKKLR